MTSLLDAFSAAVARAPDQVAIVDGDGRETTFRALERRSQRLAAQWRSQGIGPGDRVLIAMGITADLYASLAALWSLGATVVLPEPAMGLKGLRHAARTTRPKAFCASGWFSLLRFVVPELRGLTALKHRPGEGSLEALDLSPDDIALISFTSGTTGAPKAIPRTHAFLMAQYAAVAPLLASDQPERDLIAFPVFTLVNLADGRTSVLPNWKMSKPRKLTSPQVTRWMKAQSITRALIPPSICELLRTAERPPTLRHILTGGGPVFPDVVRDLIARADLRVTCVYGSTEAEPIAHLDATEIAPADWDSMAKGRGLLAGAPIMEVAVRIADNEIQVAGDHVNKGYLNPAHNTDNKIVENGTVWHRTGDAGFFDEAGRLWLLGRLGSEVETSGTKLFPFSVEVAAREWPGLRTCALMALNGEPVLCVSGDAKNRAVWERAAQGFGINRLEFVDPMPMDKRHHSKIDRVALAKRLAR